MGNRTERGRRSWTNKFPRTTIPTNVAETVAIVMSNKDTTITRRAEVLFWKLLTTAQPIRESPPPTTKDPTQQ